MDISAVFGCPTLRLKLISFDPFRTLGLPGVRYIKPEAMLAHRDEILAADRLLFPEYWQLHTLQYVLKKPVFPSPVSYHLGHDKVEMTRAFQAACPEHVPETVILPSTEQAIRQVLETWTFPLVAKQPKASQGLGVRLIGNEAQLRAWAAAEPVLYLQAFLPIERDLRVVIVGTEVVAAYWREGAGFHNNVAMGGRVREDLPVPPDAVDFVLTLAAYLGIDHAGFDVALVGGHPYLLEFNRLFGNQGVPGLSQRVSAALRHYLLAGEPDLPDKGDRRMSA